MSGELEFGGGSPDSGTMADCAPATQVTTGSSGSSEAAWTNRGVDSVTRDINPEAETHPNPDLAVVADNKPSWNLPGNRRKGFHNLVRIARYTQSFRSARVLCLQENIDPEIGVRKDVQRLTGIPPFSAMLVARGEDILYERYAPDFPARQAHSVQSITKTILNLIIGRLMDDGMLEPERRVREYLPEIGTGYAEATIQQVLDMDLVNDYDEDYTDPAAMYWDHEEAMGWRLPRDERAELRMRDFLVRITSEDIRNHTGDAQYKSANTDVLGWVVERATGIPLRIFLADVTDAAGLADSLTITTDRSGFPTMDGGASMTARDLARFGQLFVRRGYGVSGELVGSPDFIEATAAGGGVRFREFPSIGDLRYHNQLLTDGRFIGHAGYAGQFLLVDLSSRIVAVYLSVSEEKDGLSAAYRPAVVTMLREIAASY